MRYLLILFCFLSFGLNAQTIQQTGVTGVRLTNRGGTDATQGAYSMGHPLMDSMKISNDSLLYRAVGVWYWSGFIRTGAATWGSITGTLSDQTDLQAALSTLVDWSDTTYNNKMTTRYQSDSNYVSQGAFDGANNSVRLKNKAGENIDIVYLTGLADSLGVDTAKTAIRSEIITSAIANQSAVTQTATYKINGTGTAVIS